MSTVPEMVAMNAAREASEHARALEAASDQTWTLRERWKLVLFSVAAYGAGFVLWQLGAIEAVGVALVFVGVPLAAGLWLEVLHLRRRVEALAHLVLEREQGRHEP